MGFKTAIIKTRNSDLWLNSYLFLGFVIEIFSYISTIIDDVKMSIIFFT